jgi:1-acyl-sn-glycerol-3-phosphate acyltransferase
MKTTNLHSVQIPELIENHNINSKTETHKTTPTATEIQAWLVSYLAKLLEIHPNEIDIKVPFERYGMDSLAALSLTGDLKNWLNCELQSTLIYTYPTIEALAQHLATELQTITLKHDVLATTVEVNRIIAMNRESAMSVPPPRGIIARIAVALFGSISRVIWHIEVNGIENIPKTGAFILCPNHESHFDVLWIGSCLPPKLRYQICTLAKKEHFENIFNRLFVSLMGAIPTERQGNILPALSTASQVLRANRPLLIHPEGTRTRNGKMLPFHRGAANLAIATNTPLIPVRIIGAYNIFPSQRHIPKLFDWFKFKRYKLQIIFGSPIYAPQNQNSLVAETNLTEQLRQEVERM